MDRQILQLELTIDLIFNGAPFLKPSMDPWPPEGPLFERPVASAGQCPGLAALSWFAEAADAQGPGETITEVRAGARRGNYSSIARGACIRSLGRRP